VAYDRDNRETDKWPFDCTKHKTYLQFHWKRCSDPPVPRPIARSLTEQNAPHTSPEEPKITRVSGVTISGPQ